MKIAVDIKGAVTEVPENMPVKTIDGVHYLLTPEDEAEIANKEALYAAKASERTREEVFNKRRQQYGSAEEQLEYAVENSWDALVARNKKINQNNPF